MVCGFRVLRRVLSQPVLGGHGGCQSPNSAAARGNLEIEPFSCDRTDTIYQPVGTLRWGPGQMDVIDAQMRVCGPWRHKVSSCGRARPLQRTLDLFSVEDELHAIGGERGLDGHSLVTGIPRNVES